MNILFITHQLPYPPINGGRIRSYSILKTIARLKHKIILFTLLEKKGEEKYIKNLKKMGISQIFAFPNEEVIKNCKWKQIKRLLRSFINIKPYNLIRHYNTEMAENLIKYVRNNKIDTIWIDQIYSTQYLPNNFDGRKIMGGIDVESQLFKMALLRSKEILPKLFYFYEWIKFTFYEKVIYGKFDQIFTISANDKILIKKITGLDNVDELPPAIKRMNRASLIEEDKSDIILYVGSNNWYPNRDGLEWFLNSVYPMIKKERPLVELWIIGEFYPGYKPKKLNGIKIGQQKDLDNFIKNAKLFVAPILFGTGLRIKILMAMSWGIPVITTPIGSKGLNIIKEEDLIIARNEKDFADKLLKLLDNKKLRRKLITNSYRSLSLNYSYKNLEKILNTKLNQNIC